MNMRHFMVLAFLVSALGAAERQQWSRGPFNDTNYFPIAVWLQNPNNADRYKAAGINLYVGLWGGPNSNQLQTLARAKMPVICAQNRFALQNLSNSIIVGWMHGDEPDNAQSLGDGRGWGPPIKPGVIEEDYKRIQSADPTRPVLLNLGQGVAWDNWIGRGVRRNHPEDYPQYLKGCDIASFDIYPAVHDNPEVAGKLEFVARGVSRLVEWSNGEKIVWNCIEASRISNTKIMPTPEEIRAEVWMALIHGSTGLIYFVHQFEPSFKEASLLDDPVLLPAVTKLNQLIQRLAPVLNSPSIANAVDVESSNAGAPVATMLKSVGGETYLFAVTMANEATSARFTFRSPIKEISEVDSARSLQGEGPRFSDEFGGYEARIYKVRLSQ